MIGRASCIATMLIAAAVSAQESHVLFEDRFDDKLAEGWSWLNDDTSLWRVRNGALELRHLPDRNGIRRDVPHVLHDRDTPFAIEATFTSLNEPTRQWEQVGLFWYIDGVERFKFVKERIDGELYVFPGKKPMKAKKVQLRLIVRGAKVQAQYRPDAKGEWLTAFEGDFPAPGEASEQVGVVCFHGPADAGHWVRVDDFRIVRLGE